MLAAIPFVKFEQEMEGQAIAAAWPGKVPFLPTEQLLAIPPFVQPAIRTRTFYKGIPHGWAIAILHRFMVEQHTEPPHSWYDTVMWKMGQHQNVLTPSHNPAGLRQLCRKHLEEHGKASSNPNLD